VRTATVHPNSQHASKLSAALSVQVAAGRIIEDDASNTATDGLKVSLRDRTWFFVSSHVSEVLLGDRRLTAPSGPQSTKRNNFKGGRSQRLMRLSGIRLEINCRALRATLTNSDGLVLLGVAKDSSVATPSTFGLNQLSREHRVQ
jgi:hypothetical protein